MPRSGRFALQTDHPRREAAPNAGATKIRTLFLSDFHFGYKGVDGAAILDCLQRFEPQKIYLLGDIIDGWKLSKRWHWRADYTRVLDALADHRKRGAHIIYMPGNHDERVRKTCSFRRARYAFRAGIRICNSCIHRTADGKRLIVLHGDQFDNFLTGGAMSRIGDRFYDMLSEWFGLAQPAPLVMVDGRLQKFSLAKALMQKSAKAALRLMNNLERAVTRLTKRKRAHGLICGHTHVPVLRRLPGGQVFGNCGMWMGHTNTAIIEAIDGTLELLHWPDMRAPGTPEDANITPAEAVRVARHYETALTIRKISQLWPARGAQQAPLPAFPARRPDTEEAGAVDKVVFS